MLTLRNLAHTAHTNEDLARQFLDSCDPLFALAVRLHKENKWLKERLKFITNPEDTPEEENATVL